MSNFFKQLSFLIISLPLLTRAIKPANFMMLYRKGLNDCYTVMINDVGLQAKPIWYQFHAQKVSITNILFSLCRIQSNWPKSVCVCVCVCEASHLDLFFTNLHTERKISQYYTETYPPQNKKNQSHKKIPYR